MRVKIIQEKLAKALNGVSRVAGGRSTLPILSNVLVRVDESKVSLTTTNLDMAVVSYLPATQSEVGAGPNRTFNQKTQRRGAGWGSHGVC